MGLLARLERPQAATEAETIGRILRGALGGTASGVAVSPDSALRCAAVFACVRVLAEDVAKVPLILYRRTASGGKERATDHPLYPVLHDRPNPWQTSFEFREMMQGHLELRGNAFAFINRVGGRVQELLPIHPDRVSAKQEADYSLSYKVQGNPDPFPAERILHLRGLSSDGVTGMTPISLGREAVGLALAAEQHGARLFGNGARPGGILEHPGKVSAEAATRLKTSFEEMHGGRNVHRTALLEEGLKWTQIGMTSEDAQFLETRKYQRSEIAALFRVPPHKIGDLEKATFSNIEQQSLEYVGDSLQPRVTRWEQRLAASLLTPVERKTYYVSFLLEGLLRGDTKARYEAYGRAILDGWMNRNEARLREDLDPVEGLGEFLQPLNMTPAGTPPAGR